MWHRLGDLNKRLFFFRTTVSNKYLLQRVLRHLKALSIEKEDSLFGRTRMVRQRLVVIQKSRVFRTLKLNTKMFKLRREKNQRVIQQVLGTLAAKQAHKLRGAFRVLCFGHFVARSCRKVCSVVTASWGASSTGTG